MLRDIRKGAKAPRPGRLKKNGRGGARKGAGRKPGPARVHRVADYQALGDAPPDPLEMVLWLITANGVRARQVMLDGAMSDEKRGSELRSISRTVNALLPKARLRKAEKELERERGDVEADVVPKTEDVDDDPEDEGDE